MDSELLLIEMKVGLIIYFSLYMMSLEDIDDGFLQIFYYAL